MFRAISVFTVGSVILAFSQAPNQPPVKDPTGLPEKFQELIKDEVEKRLQEERLKAQADLVKRYETELAKANAALVKVSAELAELKAVDNSHKAEVEFAKKYEAQLDKVRQDNRKAEADLVKTFESEVGKLLADLAKSSKTHESEANTLRTELAKLTADLAEQKSVGNLRKLEAEFASKHESQLEKLRQEHRKAEAELLKTLDAEGAKLLAELGKTSKLHEVETDKLKTELATTRAELAKSKAAADLYQVRGAEAEKLRSELLKAQQVVTVVTPKMTFRVKGVVGSKDKGAVAIEFGKGDVRTFSVGQVFRSDGTLFRVESVGPEGAVLVVEQRFNVN